MSWLPLLAACLLACARASDYLLPGDVTPHHYDLAFAFDIDAHREFPFYGLVNIQLTALKPTQKIVLHAQAYTIEEAKISLANDNGAPSVKSVKQDDTLNFLTLELDDTLKKGENYTLTIPFNGNLKADLDGVYISSYVDSKTKAKEHLIATQFEAISARKGFPCFDEPMYKATFRINIGHNKMYTAVSNMPVKESSGDNALESYWPWTVISEKFKATKSDFVWDQFESSVPMSTYLVAWVVSKFSYVESPSDLSNTKFRIWARSDAVDQTEFAAQTGPKALSFYEGWFNVSFPLPKQDMIAIPDFNAGAMENWGLITYRETALLYDKEHSSFLNKERVCEVISHELAHQWFGNLVTMRWWSDLWLNEGFATYAASVASAAVHPEWRTRDADAVDQMLSVLSLDALHTSHPVSVPLDDPKRISEIFDEISYRKGAILIRMMVMFLGEDVFRKAIHNYLVKYSYQNAAQDDLWRELTAVSEEYNVLSRNVSVKDIMDTWTTQSGYPLLSVDRDYTTNELTVTQKRYFALGSTGADTSATWWVPLNVLCESEVGLKQAEPIQWLANSEGVDNRHKFEHGSKADEWVLFNSEFIAPYRVNYDAQNWELLSATLNSPKYLNIPTLSRVQLMADSFALAWTNVLDYSLPLQMVNYLQNETEYLPMETALSALNKINVVLSRSADYGAFQKFVRRLVTPAYMRAGGLSQKRIAAPDDLMRVKMQVMTSKWACHMKVPGCEENAIELFDQWMNTDDPDLNNPIPLDLRSTVYCIAASRGSVAHWRFLLERKRRANVAAARNSLLSGMACTRQPWLLKQYLEWTVQENSEVRRQDSAMIINAVLRSPVGYYVAREFVLGRVDDIYKAFNGQTRRMGGIVKALLDQFTVQKELDEFLVWRETNSKYLEESKLAVEQAVEKARVNIGWVTKNQQYVVDKMRQSSADGLDLVISELSLRTSSALRNNIAGRATVNLWTYLLVIRTILL